LFSAPVQPAIPIATPLPSTSATTPSGGSATLSDKKKRGRKPKTATPAVVEPAVPAPAVTKTTPAASPLKMPSHSHVGGPDTIRSPRGAGSSHSAWRGPPADSASFQVKQINR